MHWHVIPSYHQVVDEEGGHFYKNSTEKCAKCTKWVYDMKPCEAKNFAAAAEDCHQYGSDQMDHKCFTKEIDKGWVTWAVLILLSFSIVAWICPQKIFDLIFFFTF